MYFYSFFNIPKQRHTGTRTLSYEIPVRVQCGAELGAAGL